MPASVITQLCHTYGFLLNVVLPCYLPPIEHNIRKIQHKRLWQLLHCPHTENHAIVPSTKFSMRMRSTEIPSERQQSRNCISARISTAVAVWSFTTIIFITKC